ncbi:transcriptional repressor [Pseudomonas aeruginosa]|uniref:Ferric uptake regulator family protein n=1 Tax=Pseudomonas putida TaxID=303 RepID=A0A4D6XH01_PSEPU|nr:MULTISPECIES: transcriptional repressor [Pseudomonadota]AXL71799.1 Ferric uptake regulator family protein [Pseudomonas aeruginosa]MBG4699594.1 transcriptional repressor [Pseudomonas aeruginosa]MBH4275407.1 transcriptional repressor [Pseudomonas aeruginosa]MCS7572602.1 transcriptional repressor [Pseudomonas aeruginosa]MCT1165858.1 transcriptional repressor [Pseudomonas aeruginosa]
MEPHDDPPRIIDLITSFGSKNLPSGKHMMKHTAAASPVTRSPMLSQEQRLAASRLRPTIARTSVLNALEKATPSCLDASQMYRILSTQLDSLTPASIYRALNDLWIAGLLVRTEGAHGRAFYAIKPDGLNAHYDTLRCHCGARLVFIEDQVLREHLRSLAREEGFALDREPAFTITMTCTKCRQLCKGGQ